MKKEQCCQTTEKNINKLNLKDIKGITLIALVITIIVLLILAGIAISMLSGENGILNQAAKARESTDKKSTLEQIQLSVTGAMTNVNHKVNEDDLKKELTNAFGVGYTLTGDLENGWTVDTSENDYFILSNGTIMEIKTIKELMDGKKNTEMKTMAVDDEGKKAVIPEGFHLAKDSATTVKEGIVIEDNIEEENKNQFVWIPVENINEMCEQQDGRNVGILYDFPSKETSTKKAYSTTDYREPDVLEDTTDGDKSAEENRGLNLLNSIVGIEGDPLTDADEMITKWQKQLQGEFDAMIESVKINKGFYVGRYETSLNEDKTQMYSKKGAQHVDSIWYELYQYQKLYSNDKVVSSMIWGSQYDQMMRWMQKNNIDVTSSTPIVGAEKNTAATIGANDKDQLNKVYDLLGGLYEWSSEANTTSIRVIRRRLLWICPFT